jgi:prepilin-type N-terminal cleavage/methylation domain-containing protein
MRRRTSREGGYTAVEVMMALTVMSIGAAAVISMHKTSVTANLDARKTDVANGIARMWMERLQRDTMSWTTPSSVDPSTSNFSNAKLLASHVTGAWYAPVDDIADTVPTSPGLDILGRDLGTTGPTGATLNDAQFCVHVRLTWLVVPVLPAEPGLLRADVRVLWPRGISNMPGKCTDAAVLVDNPDPTNPPMYHAVYLTTTLKENGQ